MKLGTRSQHHHVPMEGCVRQFSLEGLELTDSIRKTFLMVIGVLSDLAAVEAL